MDALHRLAGTSYDAVAGADDLDADFRSLLLDSPRTGAVPDALGGLRDALLGRARPALAATPGARSAPPTAPWRRCGSTAHSHQVAESAGRMLSGILSLQGVTASMIRDAGWHAIGAGRAIERALQVCHLLAAATTERRGIDVDREIHNAVLVATESAVTHRRRYRGYVRPAGVLDLLLMDDANPRSVAFSLAEVRTHLAALPGSTGSTRPERLLDDLVAQLEADRDRHPGHHRRGGPAQPGGLPRRLLRPARPARRRRRRGPLRERPGAPDVQRGVAGRGAVVRYHVTHVTTYSYDDDVTDSLGIAHLTPRALPFQQVHSAEVVVSPDAGRPRRTTPTSTATPPPTSR